MHLIGRLRKWLECVGRLNHFNIEKSLIHYIMKKIVVSVLAFAGVVLFASAEPLTPEDALQRARTSGAKVASVTGSRQLTLSHTLKTDAGAPALYVFDRPSESGYMILSADDVASPVLGYADSGSFDMQNISPQMKWWLEQYADQIEYAVKNGVKPVQTETRAQITNVAPMIKSKWNQSAPYNDLCPVYPATGRKSVTGCVATAMAQVMNYWKYPQAGTGLISYKPNGFSSNLLMDLSQTKFDWDNMLDTYINGQYNETQSSAVATLMKACGYSVQMNYSSVASGATSYNLGNALINNFSYNKNISYEQRNYYTTSEWNQMVYEELVAGRPVLLGGQSDGGGHQFVCDGYNDGFYHINWGWGGMSDGYFKLESLNPNSEGIGGGSGGYNYHQDALIGVQPTTDTNFKSSLLVQGGSLVATASGTRVSLSTTGSSNNGWWNFTYNSLNVKIAAVISPVDDPTSTTYANCINQSIGSFRGFTSLNFVFPSTLANGKYLCKLMIFNNADPQATWQPIKCFPGMSTSVYITKSGSSLSIETIPAAAMTMTEVNLIGELYYQCVAKVSATLRNTSEFELSSTVLPVLVNTYGTRVMQGSSVAITLQPGEAVTKDWETVFTVVNGASVPTNATQYNLMFIDQNTGKTYDVKIPVILKVNSNGVNPLVYNFAIDGAVRETVNGVRRVWVVTNPAHIKTTFYITNNTGYYGYPTYVYIADRTSGIIQKMVQVSNVGVTGSMVPFTCEISYDAAEDGELYLIGVLYELNESYTSLTQGSFTVRRDTSGVDEIAGNGFNLSFNKEEGAVVADGDVTELTVVDMSGNAVPGNMEASSEGKRFVIDSGFRGVAVVKVVNASGDVRTLKIVR